MPAALVAAVVGLLIAATSTSAQTTDPPALPAAPISISGTSLAPSIPTESELAERRAALERWTREYSKWKEWNDRWQGRPEPGLFGNRERRQKPDPPPWLFDECPAPVEEAMLIDACRLLDSWQHGAAPTPTTTQTLATPAQREKPPKTSFWNHVHADALWITPSSTTASYGVIGIHVTLKVAGRWQVFVAPGAMLLNIPTPEGRRAWQPATDLGFSYRLFDVPLPGGRGQGTVHLNVARAWILGGASSAINSSLDLAGLSLTFK